MNPLPFKSLCGLLGAELTCRWKATGVGAALKDAWRAILDFLRSWFNVGCLGSDRVTAATFTVFPECDGDKVVVKGRLPIFNCLT